MKFKSAEKNTIQDRVGLGWRPELAVGVLSHLDRIDVVEVIADDLFDASRNERRALRTLSSQTAVVLVITASTAFRLTPDRLSRIRHQSPLIEVPDFGRMACRVRVVCDHDDGFVVIAVEFF